MENEQDQTILEDEIVDEPTDIVDEELDQKEVDTLKEDLKAERAKNKTLFAQKNHFKQKATKALEVADRAKPVVTETTSKKEEPDDEIKQNVSKLMLSESKRNFGEQHGLSNAETDFIFQATGGKPTKESLNDPFIKSALEGVRSQKKVDDATPGSSNSSFVADGKKWKDMDNNEKQKNFSKKVQSLRK
jgi:hypothetical protein